jgi:hypothetical protein
LHAVETEVSASSSFTQIPKLQLSLSGTQWESLNGTAAIDWFETAASVEWSAESREWFSRFGVAKEAAQKSKRSTLLEVGGLNVCVLGIGIGSGRDSHKEFRIKWGSVTIGLSRRTESSRQLSNASFTASGEACVVDGAARAWNVFHHIIRAIGGKITD